MEKINLLLGEVVAIMEYLAHGNRIIFLLAVKSITLDSAINTKEVNIEEAVLKKIIKESIAKMDTKSAYRPTISATR